MNRGSVFGHVRRWPRVYASMRPRFMNRGSTSRPLGFSSELAASMRPRFMNRGSRFYRGKWRETTSCFNEAPIHESGKWNRARSTSRAHNGFNEAPIHESGKWTSRCRCRERASSFNEAPIHESGKCHGFAPLSSIDDGLQ